jgi:hypothetical protein
MSVILRGDDVKLGSEQAAAATVDHLVQFYGSSDELAAGVTGYLGDALQAGGVALVVATPGHRAMFEARMARTGIDASAARSAGRLVTLDAREALTGFVRGGVPDRGRFDDEIGSIVRQASARGRPVHAYGEMVDLLWSRGQVAAAIEVERMWNELARAVPFSLYCAYRSESMLGDAWSLAFGQVCSLHSDVVCPRASGRLARAHRSRRLPPGPRASLTARRFVLETLEKWGRGALVGEAVTTASDLIGHVVTTGWSHLAVRLDARGDAVRISVSGVEPPLPPLHPDEDLSGTGGGRADPVAGAGWGVVDDGGCKVVWAELSPTRC